MSATDQTADGRAEWAHHHGAADDLIVINHVLKEIHRLLANGGAFIDRVGVLLHNHAGGAFQADILQFFA